MSAPTDQWISRQFLFLLIIVYLSVSQCWSVALKKGFDPKICACFALSLSVKISILFNLSNFSALVRFQNISTSGSKFSQLCFRGWGGGGGGSVFTECKLVFYAQPTSVVIYQGEFAECMQYSPC